MSWTVAWAWAGAGGLLAPCTGSEALLCLSSVPFPRQASECHWAPAGSRGLPVCPGAGGCWDGAVQVRPQACLLFWGRGAGAPGRDARPAGRGSWLGEASKAWRPVTSMTDLTVALSDCHGWRRETGTGRCGPRRSLLRVLLAGWVESRPGLQNSAPSSIPRNPSPWCCCCPPAAPVSAGWSEAVEGGRKEQRWPWRRWEAEACAV